MTGDIRVGIVGATVTVGGSGFGGGAHVPAIHAVPGLALKAVCTSREETARASAAAFGADLAFDDVHDMVAHPDVDLVVVCVRVPWHRELVMAGLRAEKQVFCEWPLGRTLGEAEEMADTAQAGRSSTMVGLQGRSDPTLRYAHDLVVDGYVGEVQVANATVTVQAVLERGAGRIWQADRSNGANPLTIPGGHGIDALCFLVGEFSVLSARVATQIPWWRDSDTGHQVAVTAPDTVSVTGRLTNGAEVVAQVATVPSHPGGTRIEIHGSEGSLLVTSPKSAQFGPHRLLGARGSASMAELRPPDRYALVPDADLTDRSRNVAEAYARIVTAWRDGERYTPDFDHAVRRHRLIDAMQHSSDEGLPTVVEP